MNIKFQEYSDVELIEFMGSDEGVVHRARVSTKGIQSEEDVSEATVKGMINHMMKNRHGSVFEGAQFTFRVHTPLFVAREFMRHRMFSYNEESGRYKQLDPVFYVPGYARPLRQVGKSSEYHLVPGNNSDGCIVRGFLKSHSEKSYLTYYDLLEQGIAREVARMVLPVNIFTTFYATCNARALMNFLSLRIDDEANSVPTHPLEEIQEVAEEMEAYFAARMPVTYFAFKENGRVAP